MCLQHWDMNAMSCDILPSETPGKHYQGDVRDILYSGFDLLIAHPPCTYLTVTGNKWFKPEFKDRFPNREEQRRDAIAFFTIFAEAPIERNAIENPVGIMSSL
jgi:site-specific DNA-cytosine methylase